MSYHCHTTSTPILPQSLHCSKFKRIAQQLNDLSMERSHSKQRVNHKTKAPILPVIPELLPKSCLKPSIRKGQKMKRINLCCATVHVDECLELVRSPLQEQYGESVWLLSTKQNQKMEGKWMVAKQDQNKDERREQGSGKKTVHCSPWTMERTLSFRH